MGENKETSKSLYIKLVRKVCEIFFKFEIIRELFFIWYPSVPILADREFVRRLKKIIWVSNNWTDDLVFTDRRRRQVQLLLHLGEELDLVLRDHRDLSKLLVGVLLTDGHQLGVGSGCAGFLDDVEQLLNDVCEIWPLVHRVVGQRRAPVLAQRLACFVLVVEELKGEI